MTLSLYTLISRQKIRTAQSYQSPRLFFIRFALLFFLIIGNSIRRHPSDLREYTASVRTQQIHLPYLDLHGLASVVQPFLRDSRTVALRKSFVNLAHCIPHWYSHAFVSSIRDDWPLRSHISALAHVMIVFHSAHHLCAHVQNIFIISIRYRLQVQNLCISPVYFLLYVLVLRGHLQRGHHVPTAPCTDSS